MKTVTWEIDDRSVVHLTLNRPTVHNAFNDELIRDLTLSLEKAASEDGIRALVLSGKGKSFSAGADLNWMQNAADYSPEENRADADRLAAMLCKLNSFPVPTVVAVNGAAFGGGIGLVASCDIALASDRAIFSLSEVRLGLIPATISPFVVSAIGERSARRYFLTGERFDATTAARIGLIHNVVPNSDLAEATNAVIQQILSGGPQSQIAAKALLSRLRDMNNEEEWIHHYRDEIKAVLDSIKEKARFVVQPDVAVVQPAVAQVRATHGGKNQRGTL